MASRVSFSGSHLGLSEIAEAHQDFGASLKLYFSTSSPSFANRFTGYTTSEVLDELDARLRETQLTSSLAILSSLEAAFRIDYLQRCYLRAKDPLSRAFRRLHQAKQHRVSLENEIFAAWADQTTVPRSTIGDLRGAFKFRHWLAHGRYWSPKFGRRYDFDDVYALAELTVNSFPLFELEA